MCVLTGVCVVAAHLALGMMGEGMMWNPLANEYQAAAKVIAENGLQPVQLHPKVVLGAHSHTCAHARALIRAFSRPCTCALS